MSRSKQKIAAVLLAACVAQMAANGIAPSLAEIQKTFPQASDVAVQYLTTLPSLWVLVMCMCAAALARRVQKRWLISLGCGLVALSGVGGFFFHGNMGLLYLWSSVLGVGIGITVPVIPVVTAMYFSGEEQGRLLGLESSAANVSMILMTVIGGMLTTLGWNHNYLVYLLAVPAMLAGWELIPAERLAPATPVEGGRKTRPGIYVLPYVVASGMVTLLFNTVPTNASILIEERGLGGSSLSGVLIAVLMTGGAVGGILFGPIQNRLGGKVMALGFLDLSIGLVTVSMAQSFPVALAGTFLSGTAITFVMPRCSQMATRTPDPAAAPAAVGLVMAGSNLGGFLSPVITMLCTTVLNRSDTAPRFWSAAAVAAVAALTVWWKGGGLGPERSCSDRI